MDSYCQLQFESLISAFRMYEQEKRKRFHCIHINVVKIIILLSEIKIGLKGF